MLQIIAGLLLLVFIFLMIKFFISAKDKFMGQDGKDDHTVDGSSKIKQEGNPFVGLMHFSSLCGLFFTGLTVFPIGHILLPIAFRPFVWFVKNKEVYNYVRKQISRAFLFQLEMTLYFVILTIAMVPISTISFDVSSWLIPLIKTNTIAASLYGSLAVFYVGAILLAAYKSSSVDEPFKFVSLLKYILPPWWKNLVND